MDITYYQELTLKIIEDFYSLEPEAVEKLLYTDFDYARIFLNNLFEFGLIDRNVCVLKKAIAQEVRLRKVLQKIQLLERQLKHPIYWLPFYVPKKRKLRSILLELNETAQFIKQNLEPTFIRGEFISPQLGLAQIFAQSFDCKDQEDMLLAAIKRYYQQKIAHTLKNIATTI